MIGSCGNDWAVIRAADYRAADYTLVTMKMVVRVAESKGRKQSRRLHPGDNEDGGESGGVKGPSAEPPTTPCWYWRSMRSLMRAVSRAADYTLMTMKMVRVAETKGRQQSRRLHPDDNEDGEGGGDKGPSAEPPTTPW